MELNSLEWIDNPYLLYKLLDLIFFFTISIIVVGIIMCRWCKERKKGMNGEEAIEKVIVDLCLEPIRNMKEFIKNIRN